MESGPRSAGRPAPRSVKLRAMSGTDYYTPPHTPGASPASGPAETRLSAWTPLVNRSRNQQLFEERISLLLHWFDLWNDRQRKHLLHALLTRCTRSQLKFCRDWLSELVPVTRVDFTAVLPRLLSLYVMSFLNPRDLCSAAQVNWHWRFLAEQDCLWAGRCVRLGWFLPYSPGEKEYGAWKKHYITCVSTLSWLTLREPAKQYGTLNKPTTGREEEEEEREKERRLRQVIREKLQEDKRLRHRNRRAWGSSTQPRDGWSRRGMLGSGVTFKSGSLLSSSAEKSGSTTQFSSLHKEQPIRPSLSLERCPVLNPVSYPPPHAVTSVPRTSPPLLLLISTRIPAYELVLSGLKAEVVLVLYDHRGTLAALLAQVERALGGQQAQRLGLLAPGGTEEVHLLHSISLSEKNVLDPDLREFWEKLCGWVVLSEEGGGVDIFSPFAASESGVALIQTLSTLTGLEVRAPMGLATGSFQNILGEWSHSGVCAGVSNLHICEDAVVPALHYVSEDVLQGWCRQAQWMEEVLRGLLGPQLHRVSLEARGRAMGYFLWERVSLEDLCVSKDATEALTEGLTALAARGEARPMEFLSIFLERWSKEKEGGANNREEGVEEFIMTENCPKRRLSPTFELPQSVLDWRGTIARELFHSEGLYLGRLGAVLKVYLEPLTAALNSNRAILSSAHIHMVLTPVTLIHKLNRLFRLELEARLEQWGAEQCVGDVCLKLCSKLRVYTNYLNNYPTALGTIDKCREKNPAFRAFMKRMDRTLATHMLSLQELLLCPVWRVEEYITLLQALTLHTPSSHPDHTHITSALNTLLQYREFIQKLKQNSERDRLMEETQKMIQGCPNLCEGNRRLIMTWDAALLRSPDEDIPDSLRTFEEVSDVGLFLFTDALVLTERNVCHTPFTLALRSAHSFLASVALASLAVREIAHSRYVSHAFVLEGPRRTWVLAAEGDAERGQILSGLRSAIHTAVTGGASVTGL